MLIDISNHPVKTNITRKVEYGGIVESAEKWFSNNLLVAITYKVYYFLDDEPLFVNDINHIVTLRATNDTFVNEDGEIVDQADSIMTEYEYFKQIRNIPIKINDFIIMKALYGDSIQRFDFDI
jgi:hypothetical protein